MLDFLPQKIRNGLLHLNIRYVYELRLRANQAVMVNVCGKYCYLSEYGLTEQAAKAIVCANEDIAECVSESQ